MINAIARYNSDANFRLTVGKTLLALANVPPGATGEQWADPDEQLDAAIFAIAFLIELDADTGGAQAICNRSNAVGLQIAEIAQAIRLENEAIGKHILGMRRLTLRTH